VLAVGVALARLIKFSLVRLHLSHERNDVRDRFALIGVCSSADGRK
jgi:hypothetical protein